MRAGLWMVIVACLTIQALGQEKFRWKNPVRFAGAAGVYRDEVRDPCIIKEGSTYYLIHTMFPFTHSDSRDSTRPDYNSSPGIRLYQSADLKNWTVAPTAIADGWLVKSSMLADSLPYKHRFWAPEIHKIDNRFYLVFTGSNWISDSFNPTGNMHDLNTFIGVSDKITGPYEHITYVPGGACDLTILDDKKSGKVYAYIPGMDVFVQEIDLSQIEHDRILLKGDRTKIVTATNNDIKADWDYKYLEGPFPKIINGRYYLFFAGLRKDGQRSTGFDQHDDLEYWTGVASASAATGPFKKSRTGKDFWGGHVAVFDGPAGRIWLSYRGEKLEGTRGLLCIDPVQGESQAGGLVIPGPSNTTQVIRSKQTEK